MAKDTKPQAEAPEQPETAPAKKKSILPLLIGVVGGVLLLAATAIVTVMLIQVSPAPATDAESHAADTTEVASDVPHQKFDSLKQSMKAQEGSEAVADVEVDSLELAALEEDSTDDLEKMLDAIESMNDQVEAQAEAQIAQESTVSAADTAQAISWIDKEKKALEEKSRQLTERAQELNAQEERIARAMLKIEQASSDRVTNLAKLYDGMEPKAVANLMANLDDQTVVAIIPRMKQKNASAVMSLLPPARAAGLSRQIINLAEE